MNRLVIIGNGFDLAHGLPTSYKDFIDDYWRGIKDSNYNDEFISFDFNTKVEFENIKNIDCISKQFIALDEKVKFSEAEIYYVFGNDYQTGKPKRNHILKYKNDFFRLINQKSVQNWVDIENEYYKELKRIVVLKPKNNLVDDNEFENSRKGKIIRLNNEFEQVKKLLENYLSQRVVNIFELNEYSDPRGDVFKFLNLFKPNTFLENNKEMENFLEEFPKPYQNGIKNQFVYRGDDLINDCKITILNFNYTPTLLRYSRVLSEWKIPNEIIYIHGGLNDNKNKINFGFGDEMDDDYKMIENIDDNEYLRNFKSFLYLQNSNYKNLLDFVESDQKFQVYIMGHSCGLSDRTMLNTIFEHPNCISIKVFYHQRDNGTDNYTEIIQNISRHFNDKKLMREKIVNKMLCQALPQIQLPKK